MPKPSKLARVCARDQPHRRRRRRRASPMCSMLSQLGGILNLQRKGSEAIAVFAQIDKAIANWEPAAAAGVRAQRRPHCLALRFGPDRGRHRRGRTAGEEADRAGRREPFRHRLGARHAGGRPDARRARPGCDPRIQGGDPGADGGLARERRRRRHHGCRGAQPAPAGHRRSLYRHAGAREATRPAMSAWRPSAWPTPSAAARCSRRWRRRARARPPRIRRWPNWSARSRTSASRSTRSSARSTTCLSLPSAERDDKGVQAINASINALRAERHKARQEINQQFPAYADLVAPKPPSVEQIKATLTDGEAMLSFYFGQSSSFVWAVPKNGPVAFAAIKATSGDIESKVRKLREALEPQAAMISDIPPFDLKLALRALFAAAAAGRKRLEAGQEPDRGDQRRARPAAAVAAADRAGRDPQR